MLTYGAGAWSTEEVADGWLWSGARAPSGALWTAGNHLWRRRPGEKFERVVAHVDPKPALGVRDLVARGDDDLFLSLACYESPRCLGASVLHFDGKTLREVEVVPAVGMKAPMTSNQANLALSPTGEVWLQSDAALWRLAPPKSP